MNLYGGEDTEEKLSPLGTWYYQGPLLFCMGIPMSLLCEGLAPFAEFPTTLVYGAPLLLIGNLLSAITLNILGMNVIKMLGAPAAQIAGKLHVLVVAALSAAFFGEK